MIKRSFYFLRHGETDHNAAGITQGHLDTVLNDRGRKQAEFAAQILKNTPITRIISSPLRRAAETAEIINQVLHKPIEFDVHLQERNYGLYQGKTTKQIEQWEKENNWQVDRVDPETRYLAPPEGEHYNDFKTRIIDAVRANIERYPDDVILFVAHGGTYKSLSLNLLNDFVPTRNAHPYHFELKDEAWRLNRLISAHENVSL